MSSESRSVRKDVLRNRNLLLTAADELIRANGMELSLNAVARHAGVGVGTVYRHFDDRDALLLAMFEQRIDRVHAILSAHLGDDDPVEALRATVFEICEMQVYDRGLWEVLSSGAQDDQLAVVRGRLIPLAETLIHRANATGRMRPGVVHTDLPVLLWTGGALSTYLGAVSPTAWQRYVQIMLDGLLIDSARAPLIHDPLTPDGISAAMQAWRPAGMRRS